MDIDKNEKTDAEFNCKNTDQVESVKFSYDL